jgi:hypothetical protein
VLFQRTQKIREQKGEKRAKSKEEKGQQEEGQGGKKREVQRMVRNVILVVCYRNGTHVPHP